MSCGDVRGLVRRRGIFARLHFPVQCDRVRRPGSVRHLAGRGVELQRLRRDPLRDLRGLFLFHRSLLLREGRSLVPSSHATEDHPLAPHGGSRWSGGIADQRCGQRRRHERRLLTRQLARRALEIGFGRGSHSENPRSELDDVQVHLEDAILGEPQLQPPGQDRLASLAQEIPRRVQIHVLRRLLADRARPAKPPAAAIRAPRLPDLLEIEALVLVEARVLRDHDGSEQSLGHLRDRIPLVAGAEGASLRGGFRDTIPHDPGCLWRNDRMPPDGGKPRHRGEHIQEWRQESEKEQSDGHTDNIRPPPLGRPSDGPSTLDLAMSFD